MNDKTDHATVAHDVGPRRKVLRWALGGFVALGLSAGVIITANASGGEQAVSASQAPSGQSDAQRSPQYPTMADSDDQQSVLVLQKQMQDGWVPFAAADVLHDYAQPASIIGWVKYPYEVDALRSDRTPVYDAPNGRIVGYNYHDLGYVNKADAASFDAEAERVARFGCDPSTDSSCVPLPKGS